MNARPPTISDATDSMIGRAAIRSSSFLRTTSSVIFCAASDRDAVVAQRLGGAVGELVGVTAAWRAYAATSASGDRNRGQTHQRPRPNELASCDRAQSTAVCPFSGGRHDGESASRLRRRGSSARPARRPSRSASRRAGARGRRCGASPRRCRPSKPIRCASTSRPRPVSNVGRTPTFTAAGWPCGPGGVDAVARHHVGSSGTRLAVGMPSSRPRLSPVHHLALEQERARPRNFAAWATSPAATRPRMWLDEIVSPAASTSGATRVSNSSSRGGTRACPARALAEAEVLAHRDLLGAEALDQHVCTNSSARLRRRSPCRTGSRRAPRRPARRSGRA